MPSARAAELQRVAARFGFERTRQNGSHEQLRHIDGRATTIPIRSGRDIGPPLFYRILEELGIDPETFDRLP